MTIQSAQPRRGLVLLFRNGGRAQVTFHHVPLKALLRTLDAISSVHRLELFRHPPNHHEERNAGADGLVFYRLSYSELKTGPSLAISLNGSRRTSIDIRGAGPPIPSVPA